MDRVQCHRFWQCNNLNWRTEKVFSILLSLSLWVYHNRIYTVLKNYQIKLLQNNIKQAKSSNNACFLSAWFCVYLSVCALTIKIQNLILKIDIFMKFGNLVYLTIFYMVEQFQSNTISCFKMGAIILVKVDTYVSITTLIYYLLQFKWIFTRNMNIVTFISCTTYTLQNVFLMLTTLNTKIETKQEIVHALSEINF